MPFGVPSQGSGGEGISHIVGVRYRVNGSGNLQTTLYSLDDVESQSLANIAMTSLTNREPTILANFIQQRTFLEMKTTDINATFKINRIILFVKDFATSYPQ